VSRRGAAAVALALLAATSCGVPTSGSAERINPDEVPYGLITSGPASSPSTQPLLPRGDQPHVYWVDSDDRVIAVRASTTGSGPAALTALLTRLTAGPSDNERQKGLGTALSPQTSVRVRALVRGVADLEVRTTLEDPAADRLPLAVGQIVLTATSLPGVNAVRLLRDGHPVAVPVVGGALISEPVGAADYAELLRPRGPRTATPPSPSSGR
jgi:hypothetical protein